MGRLFRLLLILGVLGAIAHATFFQESEPGFPPPRRGVPDAFRAPAPPDVFPQRPLPPPSAADPRGIIEVPARGGNAQGTAAVIDSRGVWLTARHVAEGCREVLVEGTDRWVRTRVAALHPQTDLAVLATRGAPPAFQLADGRLRLGQSGWAIGYPKGVPSVVEGQLLGRARLGFAGRMRGEAAVTVWTERRRTPSGDGPLSGISGGPLVDGEGRIIGVAVAATERRGRFYAASPEGMADMIARLAPADRPAAAAPLDVRLDGARAERFGAWAMEARMVTRVGCRG
ncbi:serine protease [Stella sp.]|uniref:S1 family peptidase n=1 Tax=Stella sp. TaxID=2912054 RepID=UPI0035B212AC